MRALLFAALGVLAIALPGCGGVYYAATVNAATSSVEEARELGAETRAPYEYYYAKAHLEQAQVEASEASYGDAAHFAQLAEEYANKAIAIIREGGGQGGPTNHRGSDGP
jgi:hypothetical protein